MVAVRTVAMAYNRLSDKHFDAANPRTATRALPAGRLAPRHLWTLLIAAASLAVLAAVTFAVAFDNVWPIVFIAPLFLYICGYSHAKRFTAACHLYLGSVLGLSVPATVLALTGSLAEAYTPGILILFAAILFWTAGFDILYALLDIDFDRRTGLCSVPAKFGPARALWLARGFHLLAWLGFATAGLVLHLGPIYAVGLLAAAILLIVQHRLVRPDDFSRVNAAFFTANGLLSIFLSCAGIIDVLIH
jgi:4-hydroxybenzoate polyprenyltransferase